METFVLPSENKELQAAVAAWVHEASGGLLRLDLDSPLVLGWEDTNVDFPKGAEDPDDSEDRDDPDHAPPAWDGSGHDDEDEDGHADDGHDYDLVILPDDAEGFDFGGPQDDGEEDGDVWPEFDILGELRFGMEAGEQDRRPRGVRETKRPRRMRFQKRQRVVLKPARNATLILCR